LLEEIDRIGGGLRAVETGYTVRLLEESAYRYQRAIEDGSTTVAGVNRFRTETADTQPAQLLRLDPTVRGRQIARLTALRGSRDSARAEASLNQLRAAAAQSGAGAPNLMPLLVECARAQSTLGEMAGALRAVFGEYRP